MSIKINTDLYKEIHHQLPRDATVANWIFEDQEGLWRHTGYGPYALIAAEARQSYEHLMQTRFGIIQVLP